MTEKDFDFENDKEFNALIESSLGEFPPDYVTDEITPWRKATRRVIWGLALRMMVLEVLGLNYILPFIGTVLTLLGFRALRRENKWFKACNILNIVYAVSDFTSIIFNTTVLDCGEVATKIIIAVNIIATLLLLICLWQAFRAVRRKAGLLDGAKSAAALIVWYVALAALGLLNYEGLIIPILMIVLFILMIRSLLKLSKELDEAGYAINAAPVKMSDKALTATVCLLFTVGMVCGYAFFNSYPMKWEPVETNETAQITEIKENLLELGFPEDILKDISDEDILECEGAFHVLCSEDHYYYLSEANELRIRGVAVRLSGEGDNWKMFHHFIWLDSPKFYGTEGIQIWISTQEWEPKGEASGRIFYDEDGKTHTASYYSLSIENTGYTLDAQVYAGFSLPDSGENHRGYVSYNLINSTTASWSVMTRFAYTHPSDRLALLRYPAMSALDNSKASAGNTNGSFDAVNEWFQFFIDPDTGEIDIIGETEDSEYY
ncbi:MAG: hypothetical protein J1E05_05385 [Eubacterium sp.]|nr:hypothetical protein [Eubacterium sp.]